MIRQHLFGGEGQEIGVLSVMGNTGGDDYWERQLIKLVGDVTKGDEGTGMMMGRRKEKRRCCIEGQVTVHKCIIHAY
jgi:hypothetical protein